MNPGLPGDIIKQNLSIKRIFYCLTVKNFMQKPACIAEISTEVTLTGGFHPICYMLCLWLCNAVSLKTA